MRNYIASELAALIASNDANPDWTPQMEFVDLFLNGQYRGQYVLAEKNRLDKDSRFAIKSIEDEYKHGTGDETKYGFVVEIDSRADAKYYFKSQYTNLIYTLCDPDLEGVDPEDITAADETAIVDYIKGKIYSFEDALFNGTWSELNSLIDVDSFVNWIIVNEFMKNIDAGHLSTYMWYDPGETGKIHFGPIWDFDLSAGKTTNEISASPEGTTIVDEDLFVQLLSITEFKQAIIDKWKKINGCKEVFEDFIENMDNTIYERIKLSAELNFLKFQNLGVAIEDSIYGILERSSYKQEYLYLKTWMSKRLLWMDKLIDSWDVDKL